MSRLDSDGMTGFDESRKFTPFLILLFIGSGCSALIYEIIWFQQLELVIGSSAVSLGLLLAMYMGGMCLGSLFASRILPDQHPLRLYALIEIGIGLSGLLILFGLPYIGYLYISWAGQGIACVILRGIIAASCLLPPTFLMGATLPAISRWVKTTRVGMSWLGFFYGGNIGGAVLGCLLAGFYLLRIYDVAIATYAAVAINFIVAAIAFVVARMVPYKNNFELPADSEIIPASHASAVYLTIALSGFTALASEVIWTRLLSLRKRSANYIFLNS